MLRRALSVKVLLTMPATSARPKVPPPPVEPSAPATGPLHQPKPGSAQLTAVLLPAAAGVTFLAVLGMAWTQPDVPLIWAPALGSRACRLRSFDPKHL